MRRGVVQTLKGFGWRQWLVVLLFFVVLGATALHATFTLRRAIYWRQHQDDPIRGWMTVGYVAHSYRVPPRVLYEALDLPPREPHDPHAPRDRRPLREIAREQGRTVEEITATLQAAIARERERQRATPPNPRAPPTSPHAPPPPPPRRDDGGKP
ncbi:MAG: hypothetical protein ABR563_13885 [Pyrinomonadaceae bacterium]